MNRLFAFILLPFFVVSAGLSGMELYSFAQYSNLPPMDGQFSASSELAISGDRQQAQNNLFVAARQYEEAAQLPLAVPEAGYRAARILYRTGLLERDENQRIAALCRSLSQLGGALTRDPLNSRLLINWANLRQLLSGIECSEPHTQGNFETVARYALERDPTNAEVIFSTAQIFLWAQKADEAHTQLRRFLEYSQHISERQYSFTDRLLNSPESISRIIPPQFPQVVEWSERIQDKSPALFIAAKQELAALQLEAVAKNERAFRDGQIPAELYFDRLSSILNVVSSSAVRRKIDGELSRFYGAQGQDLLRSYLDLRRLNNSLDVARSSIIGDTRPAKSSLITWEPLSSIALDYFYSSVGFYLPRDSTVNFIELVGNSKSPLIPTVGIKILASDDNRVWEDVTRDVKIESLDFARRSRIVISLKNFSRRFCKIHFNSSSREGRFVNGLTSMLQVYGSSTREP